MSIKNMVGLDASISATLDAVISVKDTALAQFANPLAEASTMKAAVEGEVAGLVGKLGDMIPALPELPNLSAQGAIGDLANIDVTSIAGSANLSKIKDSFGDTLGASGIDIDSVVSQVQGGVDIGGLIPNLELGLDGIPFELPANISFSSVSGLKELLPEIPKFDITIDNDTLTRLYKKIK